MIDGHRILQYLQRLPAGIQYVRTTIQPLLGILASSTCPIYFVLTKWDIVHGFGEPSNADEDTRLRMVCDALMVDPHVRAVVDIHSMVRLIPVSAVGPGFAELDVSTGRVVKRHDGQMRPTNIDAPLAAVLPDVFRQVQSAMGAADRDWINAQVRGSMRLTAGTSLGLVATVLAGPAGRALRMALQLVFGPGVSHELTTMMLDWIGRPFADKVAGAGATRVSGERNAETVRQARAKLLDDFQRTTMRLEVRLPASMLTGRYRP
jgi:hypothetical protein